MKPLACLAVVCTCLCALSGVSLAQGDTLQTISSGRSGVLQVDCGGGDVVLAPQADASAVTLRIARSGPEARPIVSVSHRGVRLILRVTDTSSTSIVPFAEARSVSYTIAYPGRMHLIARVSSGNVTLVAPTVPAQIYDDSGNVAIQSPRAAVTAQNGGGNITVTHARAAFDVAANDGSIDATVDAGWSEGEIRMQTAAGSIRLTLPRGFSGRVDARGSASVRNAFPASKARTPLVWLYAPAGSVTVSASP